MEQNMGDADRVGRMLIAGVLAIVFFQMPRSPLSIAFGLVSVVLFVTSLAGWSLLYFVFRFSTRSDKDVKPLNRPNGEG
jgi:Protein of unknown function (DUF2892)